MRAQAGQGDGGQSEEEEKMIVFSHDLTQILEISQKESSADIIVGRLKEHNDKEFNARFVIDVQHKFYSAYLNRYGKFKSEKYFELDAIKKEVMDRIALNSKIEESLEKDIYSKKVIMDIKEAFYMRLRSTKFNREEANLYKEVYEDFKKELEAHSKEIYDKEQKLVDCRYNIDLDKKKSLNLEKDMNDVLYAKEIKKELMSCEQILNWSKMSTPTYF